ncbi:MAG: DNA polymerase III subunit alpha [Thermodesulfobacteriota bacterium]
MTTPSQYVHLHVHTEYSLLDGAIRLNELIKAAKGFSMPAVAITDHGNMFGVLKFYLEARKAGLKPILGVETYVAPRGRQRRDPKDPVYHLVLLARNHQGYRNLTRLVTLANLEGFYYKPRVDHEILAEFNEGLIAMSACLHGQIPRLLMSGQEEEAMKSAEEYARIFPGRFYLELQKNFLPEQEAANQGLVHLAQRLGLPLVATNDCHYLRKKDAGVHDILLCIQTGKTLEEENRLRFTTQEFYFKSPEEMGDLFEDQPEALANSLEIARQCDVELPLEGYHFPEFELANGEDLSGRLTVLARAGLEKRLAALRGTRGLSGAGEKEYRDRLEHELEVIAQMGFPGYFLIVADFINYARSNNIPVGPGRGSAAGSLVAYATGITDIDPLPYGLLFERFLNLERISMPDIDIDFCTQGRERVIKYVTEKYGGQEYVAQIITFGQMQARAVIRDVGRALGMSYGDVDRIAKLVPNRLKITLAEALREEPRLVEATKENDRVARLLEAAQGLEALPRHASTHAAGVVIGDRPLVDYLPLYCVAADGEAEQTRQVVTQYDMKGVEKIGLIKFDFLGLKTLTLIDQVKKLLLSRGLELDLDRLDLTDKPTYDLLSRGDTTGVFQLESQGMREILTKLKPNRFEDIIALVALYRPGPLKSGMVETFIQCKHGQIEVTYELPELEPILKETYGVILYQEQVMQIASLLADYSLGEADLLRRAMGKKIPEEMAKQKGRFMDGARGNRLDEKKAARIFDLMANFAEYGFNKSHSAAYALIAFQTAYLKANHPVEFMAALLTSEVNNQEKIVRFIAECRERGLVVLPPDINASGVDFTVLDGHIRFGLAAIKGVGQAAIDSILEARLERPFSDLFDFCERVDLRRVNRRVLEALIKCGAFDSTGTSRAKMAAVLDDALERGSRLQREREQGQTNLFDVLGAAREEAPLRWPDVPEWRESLRLAYEKESLGFYITGHPLARYEKELIGLASTDAERIKELPDKSPVRLAGVVSNVQAKMSKKNERYAFLTVEDLTGLVEVLVFSNVYQASQEYLQPDAPILVLGELALEEKGGATTIKIRAREIMPLEIALEKMAKAAAFSLTATGLERRDLLKLKAIIEAHRGQTPAALKMNFPGRGTVMMKISGGVKVNRDLLREVRETLGERALTVNYH